MIPWLCFSILGVLFILNVGAIRKNEDPIARTQTDPISYKQKLEETKDGVKGAPSPSFKYYEKEAFMVKSPMGAGAEGKASPTRSGTAEVSEVKWEDEALREDKSLEEEEVAEDTEDTKEIEATEETEETEEIEETDETDETDEEWWLDEETEEEENPEESGKETDLEG